MEVSEVVAAERALSGVGATLPDDLTDWLSSSIEMELKAGLVRDYSLLQHVNVGIICVFSLPILLRVSRTLQAHN